MNIVFAGSNLECILKKLIRYQRSWYVNFKKRVMIQIEVITLIQAEIDNESILITLNVR